VKAGLSLASPVSEGVKTGSGVNRGMESQITCVTGSEFGNRILSGYAENCRRAGQVYQVLSGFHIVGSNISADFVEELQRR